MLKLTRNPGETITLFLPDGRTIEIVLDQSKVNQARLGIAAPEDIKILRSELIEQQTPSRLRSTSSRREFDGS